MIVRPTRSTCTATRVPYTTLFLSYRGGPPSKNDVPMDKWTPDEVAAHIGFMNDFAARLEGTSEFIDGQALSPDGVWVRYDGEGRPPVTAGQIGRAPVCTPVTNAQLVCRLLLEKTQQDYTTH